MNRIGFGGSCHWCTEAIFLSLKGVLSVDQGWIAADGADHAFSEAVIVTYDTAHIDLGTLVKVHLYTHSCTSEHSMRSKYRSAVYVTEVAQEPIVEAVLQETQAAFSAPIITQILPLIDFKLNTPDYQNYYFKAPDKPFCENIVNPKLRQLISDFKSVVDTEKLVHLIKSEIQAD